MSYQFSTQTNVSLRERVTNDIRNAILKGQLSPKDRIKELDISKQMGVSRGPVREAIRQLEREGLVISQPYRETVVADIHMEEVRDVLIPIRFHLEWFMIKKYIHQMDDSFFNLLQEIISDMNRFIQQKELDKLVELDVLFHKKIVHFANERTVSLTWNSILNQIRIHFIKNIKYFNIEDIKTDHQLLLDHLKSKHLPSIQTELIRHMKGDESFLCFIEDQNDSSNNPSSK